MKRFRFKARTNTGQLTRGIVEASSQKAALQVLRDKKLYPIDIHVQDEIGFFITLKKVKFQDLVIFTRQLATMINAGLPLIDALSILELQSSPSLRPKIAEIIRSIEGGSTFSDALAQHTDTFSAIYIALIRAGEAAGVLDQILLKLADNMEKQRDFRAKTKGALIYPVIVLIGMVIVGIVMMVFVLPKLTAMYKDFNTQLPTVTKILITISNVLAKTWYFFIFLLLGLLQLPKLLHKNPYTAYKFDEFLLKLPIFGKIKQTTTMAEFNRTLSLLVSAGVPLVEALQIVTAVVNNQVYALALQKTKKAVEKGQPLSASIARFSQFPPIVPQMISAGEQTGKLDSILARLAAYFEMEAEYAIKNLSSAMEPVIMILLGLGVGFLILAIIVPIYNLTSAF